MLVLKYLDLTPVEPSVLVFPVQVCVLADGQVLEYDSPQTLMADNKSEFAALLHAHHASQHQ
jgi:ABC-type multidrug transport system fused ATPase/permease subunit